MVNSSSSFSLSTEGSGSAVEPKMFEVDYGSGSVLGMEGSDDVILAGLGLSQVLFGLVIYEDQQVTRVANGRSGVWPPCLHLSTGDVWPLKREND